MPLLIFSQQFFVFVLLVLTIERKKGRVKRERAERPWSAQPVYGDYGEESYFRRANAAQFLSVHQKRSFDPLVQNDPHNQPQNTCNPQSDYPPHGAVLGGKGDVHAVEAGDDGGNCEQEGPDRHELHGVV